MRTWLNDPSLGWETDPDDHARWRVSQAGVIRQWAGGLSGITNSASLVSNGYVLGTGDGLPVGFRAPTKPPAFIVADHIEPDEDDYEPAMLTRLTVDVLYQRGYQPLLAPPAAFDRVPLDGVRQGRSGVNSIVKILGMGISYEGKVTTRAFNEAFVRTHVAALLDEQKYSAFIEWMMARARLMST